MYISERQADSDAVSSSVSDVEESPLVWDDSTSDAEAVDDEELDIDSIDRVDYGGPRDFEDKSSVTDSEGQKHGDEMEELGDADEVVSVSDSDEEIRKSDSEPEPSVKDSSSSNESGGSDEED